MVEPTREASEQAALHAQMARAMKDARRQAACYGEIRQKAGRPEVEASA